MPLLTLPLALLALASLPALVAIYWLRNKLRRQEVSSIHLWAGQREAREGGQRVQRMQIPLLLILELLALALLALAATDPRVLWGSEQRLLVVVLDDSYSMQAGGRTQAQQELRELLRQENPLAARFVLAGQTPQALSSQLSSMSQVDGVLEGWRCLSPSADLWAATGLAFELAGPQGRVLVVTDQPLPASMAGQDRLVWKAVGEAQPNVAIVNAVRTTDAAEHRVLLEIANLSATAASTRLSINQQVALLDLAAGELRRLWFTLPDARASVQARLDDDALLADNAVVLLPGTPPPVRVAMSIADSQLGAMLARAIEAQGGQVVDTGGDLVITDAVGETGLSSPARWRVRWLVEEDAAAYVGPFLVDEQHPLTQGLELEGVVWGASSRTAMPGRTIVAAGNTPLVSVTDRTGQKGAHHDVTVRLNPAQSTIGSTPAFPVLIWNLLAWRQSTLPGLSAANVRLGQEVTFTLPPVPTTAATQTQPRQIIQIVSPDQQARMLEATGASVVLTADQPGVYQVIAQGRRHELAVNTLSQEESDLRNLSRVTAGNWATRSTLRREYTSIAWLVLLGVMGVLTLHAYLAWKSAGAGR